MSDEDDIIIGTLLPQFAEDEIPSKKPTTVADQIAVDSNGKRRFHGAFTGGFSAGFWNTVGSLEGWQPKTFKSSRGEKATIQSQVPNDFMDDEDVGEFGIAPHRIQTTEEFTENKPKKARISLENEGPVRGNPVTDLFLAPVKGKISINLLRKMGWKDEDGFRSTVQRITPIQPQPSSSNKPETKVYNCDMGPIQKNDDNDDDDDEDDGISTRNMEIFSPNITFKINRFGLGYVGLSKYTNVGKGEHIHLFGHLEAQNRKSKKLPIKGQAFGVGAFEEDDDDIYARQDMSSYDFSLGDKPQDANKSKQTKVTKKSYIIAGCVCATVKSLDKPKITYTVPIPHTFQATNWLNRKTRFGPLLQQTDSLAKVKYVNLNPDTRRITLLDDNKSKQSTAEKETIQPTSPSNTEKPSINQLKIEYAKKLAEKIDFDRFVSEKDIGKTVDTPPPPKPKETYEIKCKRTRIHWQPGKILCQKMNIAEPITGHNKTNNKPFLFFESVANTSKNRHRTEVDLVPSTINETKEDELIAENIKKHSKVSIRNSQSNFIKSTETQAIASSSSDNIVRVSVPSATIRRKPIKKTELELRIEKEMDKHPVEKKDLFKSIFSSDDESDNEEGESEKPNKIQSKDTEKESNNPVNNPIISESILVQNQKTILPSPNQILSLLSNSTLFKSQTSLKTNMEEQNKNIASSTRNDVVETSKSIQDSLRFNRRDELKPSVASDNSNVNAVYGPCLPTNITKQKLSENDTSTKDKRTVSAGDNNDEWVEKNERKRKKKEHHHKKNKKHKKHKR